MVGRVLTPLRKIQLIAGDWFRYNPSSRALVAAGIEVWDRLQRAGDADGKARSLARLTMAAR